MNRVDPPEAFTGCGAADTGWSGDALANGPARPLRILTYLHSFGPGGVERVALRLNRAWRALGAETIVIVGRDSGVCDPADAPHCRLLRRALPFAAQTQLGWAVSQLPAIIRQEQPDILFCAGNTYSSVNAAMKLALGSRCPPIIAKVSNDLARPDMSPLLRAGYHRWLRIQGRAIDRFVAMAPPLAPEIAELMRIVPARVATILDPALSADELAQFAAPAARSARADAGRHFLAVGRLARQKNFALLLDAFALAARPGDRLTILGEGPERAALTRRIARRGLTGRVAMPGHISDLPRWFADADTLILSSDFEGVPAVVVEALAAGIGIVATRCSNGMDDLLGHGRFGRLVPPRDAALLAAALADAPRRQRDPGAAIAHARRFTVEIGAAAYLVLMQQLARAGR